MKIYLKKNVLEGKLLSLNLLAFGIASVCGFVLVAAYLWHSARSELARHAEVTAQLIAQNSAAAILFNDSATAGETLAALALEHNVSSAALLTDRTAPFASYRRAAAAAPAELPDGLEFEPVSNQIQRRFSATELLVQAPVLADGRRIGALQMRIDLHEVYLHILATLAVIAACSLLAVLLAARLLRPALHSLLQPVRQLLRAMQDVASNDDYTQRAAIASDDEIGQLGKSFNFMIEQIQRRDAALGKELVERKRAEIQLDHVAHYDSVTGLPNRQFFNHCAAELTRVRADQQPQYALLCIDLDDFKYVNDTFGHGTGDALLKSVAGRMQEVLRTNDLVMRLGGDEFSVLLDHPKTVADALRLAHKLQGVLNEKFLCDGNEFNLSASIGLAMMPDHVSRFEDLLTCADAAMYVAKASGKNNVHVWSEEIARRTEQRFTIESGLRRAIGNGELELYYQPIVDLACGRVAGMEALLRWRHPLLGFVSPGEFIPIAEESQLIVEIGDWVLRQACTQARAWSGQYGDMFVAVNVSARQFRDPGFAAHVAQVVAETGCPVEMLELELTETMLMSQTSGTQAILDEISEQGVRLSLDDFGTGYSSLAYLKRFPIQKLKIDRSFVSDLPHDQDDAAIAQTIIALSRHMDMRVVAEGIETAAQADFLRSLGCTYAQGFLFSQPLTATRFENFISSTIAGPAPRTEAARAEVFA